MDDRRHISNGTWDHVVLYSNFYAEMIAPAWLFKTDDLSIII
ncbi:MAG: hypothetical protein ACJAW4_002235 [Paracoccaceae bacterium]|jgi:hypothetical protein